jgi:hypothetical protein
VGRTYRGASTAVRAELFLRRRSSSFVDARHLSSSLDDAVEMGA